MSNRICQIVGGARARISAGIRGISAGILDFRRNPPESAGTLVFHLICRCGGSPDQLGIVVLRFLSGMCLGAALCAMGLVPWLLGTSSGAPSVSERSGVAPCLLHRE